MKHIWGQCLVSSVLCAAAMALSGCGTAAVSAAAVGAVTNAVGTNSQVKEMQRRSEMQADMRAFEEAQTPQYVETETSYLRMIEQMQKQGLWFASLAHIDALESRWKVSDSSTILRADALRQSGNGDASRALYQQLLGGKLAARALHGMGLLEAHTGQFEAAVAHFESAKKHTPTDALLLNDLGFALLHTQRARHAGLPLKQAAQLQPQNPRIQSNLALYLLLYGKTYEAQEWMQQTAMTPQQRLNIMERAKGMKTYEAATAVPTSEAIGVFPVSQPQADVCAGCLIFEKKLASSAFVMQ